MVIGQGQGHGHGQGNELCKMPIREKIFPMFAVIKNKEASHSYTSEQEKIIEYLQYLGKSVDKGLD